MTQETTIAPGVEAVESGLSKHWFVLRDLKRSNSKTHAFEDLEQIGFEVFTPMMWKVINCNGKRKRIHRPVLCDLLFVHSDQDAISEVIDTTPTLQFRYVKGGYRKPMIVSDREMEHFIRASGDSNKTRFLTPDETEKLSIGAPIRILDGSLAGVEGKIVKIRGARHKRILVEIPGFISALVELGSSSVEIIADDAEQPNPVRE